MFFKYRFDFVRTSFNKIKYQLSRLEPILFYFTYLYLAKQRRHMIQGFRTATKLVA